MKVLHIIASLDESAGGPSRSVPLTCRYLARAGVQIELIAAPSANPVELESEEGLQVRFLHLKELHTFGKNLRKGDYDLVHLQHIWHPYIHVMAKAARRAGIAYLITPRGMLEPWIMNRNRWKKQLAMFLYQRRDIRKASVLHATCQLEQDNIRALGFKNTITNISNGMELATIPSPKENYGSKKLVFLSRIHPKKGIELLLEVWKQLNQSEWTLEIAGNGDENYLQALQNKIKHESITGVSLVGPQYGEAKWNFLKSADLFVLPTYSENFGIAIAEALAVGVPVITTTGTPWKELETHHCGWWIDLSVDSLTKTLKEAMHQSSTDLRQMGMNGVQLIRKQYSIEQVSERLILVYRDIIEKR
ncbi:glycosyltransferase [Mangrovibacterium diazotrophicum]|uniref:Glycosyltransferase involved in cell wall biosynthesis n=1 Tax=Mangrovibacterium diazotrophicum TaxID=1261403 RepID=A0A419VWW3_9BACT|nr:glycosyltransferase [Mangrovibacterium diazotrophicum]RKD87721.1 glycosyltransferase involved in cell wall biosynthesis [Mangrovibacterium diazotrophicum]